jgi:hypothetical protein
MRMMRGVMAETRSEARQRGADGVARAEASHHEGKESMALQGAQICAAQSFICASLGVGRVLRPLGRNIR